MQPAELKQFIKRIRNAYGLKQVDEEILTFLYEKCGNIPSHAIEWIEDRFQTLYDKFPVKLHGAIMACWWDYLREHPQDKAREYKSCPYCEDGMLRLGKPVAMYGGAMTEFVANCGHCKQRADEKKVPMLTVQQAADLGYKRWNDEEKPHIDYSKSSWWHNLVPRIGNHESLPQKPDNQPESEVPF